MSLICAGCNQQIPDRRFLECSLCSCFYDIDCANVSEQRFYNTMTADHKKKWKCPLCLSKAPKFDNKNTPIRQLQQNPPLLQPLCSNKARTNTEVSQPSSSNVTFRKKPNCCKDINSSEEEDSICLLQGNTQTQEPNSPNKETESINIQQFNNLLLQHSKQNNEYIISNLRSTLKKDIENAFRELKDEFKHTTEKMKKKQSEIDEKILALDQKTEKLQHECYILRTENKNLQNEIEYLKKPEHTNKIPENNDKIFVLHGLTYNYQENNYNLTKIISNIFYEALNINLSGYIEEISFIGKKGLKRPIKIELISKRMIKYILENAEYFKITGLCVSKYLDTTALQEIRQLKQALQIARKNGQHAIIRNKKLIVNGQESPVEKTVEKTPNEEMNLEHGRDIHGNSQKSQINIKTKQQTSKEKKTNEQFLPTSTPKPIPENSHRSPDTRNENNTFRE